MIPEDIEEIIIDYKYQIEHLEKFKKCINQINNINYTINRNENGYNIRSYSSRRDNTFYSIIMTESSETFMAENIDIVTTILVYNYGEQKIYINIQEVN